MEKKKKRLLVLSVCAVLLAAFLIVYHLPRTFRWTGTAQSHVNSIDMTSELEIDVRMWPKLFREPDFTGSVTVEGKRYEDIQTAHHDRSLIRCIDDLSLFMSREKPYG